MKINSKKTKIISESNQQISINGEEINHVEEFNYLGSMIPETSNAIKKRIAIASAAFGRLKEKIWSKRNISFKLKTRLYAALIQPIVTYAAETWTIKEEDKRRLESFEMRCLRIIRGVNLTHHMRSDRIREDLDFEYNNIL